MQEVKNIFLFLLLAGSEVSKTNLIYTLSELADKSGISGEEDFDENVLCKEYLSTVQFVNNSVDYFKRAKKDLEAIDEFIEYYKEELIKIENYELINHLDL